MAEFASFGKPRDPKPEPAPPPPPPPPPAATIRVSIEPVLDQAAMEQLAEHIKKSVFAAVRDGFEAAIVQAGVTQARTARF